MFIHYFTTLRVFHTSINLSDRKSPQVSWNLLSSLVDFNCAVAWMVPIHVPILKSFYLLTVPNAPITIGITITFIFHCFFSSQARSRYLSLFLLSFNFTLWMTTFTIGQVLCFLLTIIWPGRLAEIR